jgi:hypothetical protein
MGLHARVLDVRSPRSGMFFRYGCVGLQSRSFFRRAGTRSVDFV